MSDWKDDVSSKQEVLAFELYHENSKQRRHDFAFNRRIYEVNKNPEFHRFISRNFKSYPGAVFTPLPTITPGDGTSFEHVAASRRSIRRFSGQALDIEQLSRLLYFGNGITGQLDASEHGIVQPVRATPSGGALYPVELYIIALAVDGLSGGVYHYAVARHGMECLKECDAATVLSDSTSDPKLFSNAAVAFVISGNFGRAHFKYGERGYRFTLLEAGHICQNLLLASTAMKLGAVAVGGFLDDDINALLDLDGVDEASVYIIAVGHPAERETHDPNQVVNQLLIALSEAQTKSQQS